MSHAQGPEPTNPESSNPEGRVDRVALLYILGGIPAIVGFIVILFLLVGRFPSLPA